MFHFYLMAICCQALSRGWCMRNLLLLVDLPFAWATAQSAGPFGHDSGGGEFTIGCFVQWHILRMNRRWCIYGLRLPIEQWFWFCRIHSEILIMWHFLRENRIWFSNTQRLSIRRQFRWRRIHSDALFWWNLICAIWRWCRDGLRLPIGRRRKLWPGACRGIFVIYQEEILVEIKGSKVRMS